MLIGFDDQVAACRNETSRSHIREAIRCYEAGSYRASIVTCYVAVCYDLISKLRALAAAGDVAAADMVSDLVKLQTQRDSGNLQAISGLLTFERQLIEQFRDKFEFFGINEFEDIVRLREDRNRCAHPTFFKSEIPYEPTPELARLHIRNSLTHILVQEPRQGKAALEEIRNVILDPYFPEKTPEVITRLSGAGLSRARHSLIKAVVDDIIFGVPDKAHPYFTKVAPFNALDAVIEMNREIALSRAVSDVDKLLNRTEKKAIDVGSIITLRQQELAQQLNDASRVVVRSWIGKNKEVGLANVIRHALKNDWLKDAALLRIKDLDADKIEKVTGNVPSEIIDRAVEIYASSRSWDEANSVAAKCALPFADKMTEENIETIFSAAKTKKADLVGSHSFSEFIRILKEKNSLGKDRIDELLRANDLEYYID